MTHRISSDGKAVVDTNLKWRRIDKETPTGKKIWLINDKARSATQGMHLHGNSYFTHWLPLPTFPEDDK